MSKTIKQNGNLRHLYGMNRFLSLIAAFIGLFFADCGESPMDPRYSLELPALPQAWETILGSPHWRIEWQNSGGVKETATLSGSGLVEITLPQIRASAVYAMPYWPEKGLSPGVFKPAGAIFPFDVYGKKITLSWQGGIDACMFRELAVVSSGAGRAVSRLPHNFNWPRFRQLFDDESVNEAVRADPWLADWRVIAEKTVQSGFDKRRLVPEARTSLKIPVGPGPWIGSSPFTAPLVFESTPSFPVRNASDTWVSAEGILRCNAETWIVITNGR
jgi:hypothetical protein